MSDRHRSPAAVPPFRALRHWLGRLWPRAVMPSPIPESLWQGVLEELPFVQQLSAPEREQLRSLCCHFLHTKEFTGMQGLVVTDAMALAIAAQACVLVLHWGTPNQALRWYRDFVGIVIYPGDVLAQRTYQDAAGVVHHYQETLLGEAMEGGPVVLSARALQPGGHPDLGPGSNVVLHEFAHKLDMAQGGADGCPPLPAGFLGHTTASAARAAWAQVWQSAYDDFCEAVAAHARFGQPAPWLDAYAAEHPSEFFAVACEAYWTAPPAFARAHPTLVPLLDALFRRKPGT